MEANAGGLGRTTSELDVCHVPDRLLRQPCVSSAVHTPLPTVAPSAQVYHPNIDLEGKICLNILREDWKPVLSISSVIYGLQVGRAGAQLLAV